MTPNWDEGTWDSGFWDEPTPPAFQPLPTKTKKTNPRIMASNPTPPDDDLLIALAEDLADGAHTHEVSIGIKQNTEAVLRAALAAVPVARSAIGAANGAVDAAYDVLQAADAAGEGVLKNCRLRMVKLHGTQFTAGWQEAGWPNQSTAIPSNQDQRFTLLGGQALYFTNHPTAESADMEATAALCTAAHEAVSDARAAVNAAEAAQETAKTNLAAAIRTLRKRVRGLIDELGTLLADDDARYEAFGLNIPAHPSAPEGIEELTLTALGSGKVHVQWSYATRMTGARVRRKLPGPDEEFASVGTAVGLEKVLTGQPVGALLEIQVVPYNDGGDGSASPTKTITVT
jgi:hypothetical protein